MVVDAASGKGRVMLFANNPIYRWQTFGEHGDGVQRAAVLERPAGGGAGAKPAPATAASFGIAA